MATHRSLMSQRVFARADMGGGGSADPGRRAAATVHETEAQPLGRRIARILAAMALGLGFALIAGAIAAYFATMLVASADSREAPTQMAEAWSPTLAAASSQPAFNAIRPS